jgi:hypothetical protein
MFAARFWLSLAERALKTFAQTLVALWPLGENALGLIEVNWQNSLSVAGLAALISALTSIASAGIGPDGSPSLVGEPAKQPEALIPNGDNPVDASDKPGRHLDDGEPTDIPASRFPPPSATRRDIQG